MRMLFSLLGAAALFSTSAQIDVSKMMQQRMQQNQGQQGGTATGQGDVKVQDDTSPYVPNTFIGSFRMEMHTFNKGTEDKHSPMNLNYAFREDMTSAKIDVPDEDNKAMGLLFDLKNKWQYMLMEDKKGQKMAIKQKMKKMAVADGKDDDEMKITVTDEYKDIDGHKCRKITGENKDSKGEWWVAEDVPLNIADVMNLSQGRGRKHDEMSKFGGKGLPMEMTWEKKDGSEKILSHTKDLLIGKVDPARFDLSGYEIQDMTAMPGFGH